MSLVQQSSEGGKYIRDRSGSKHDAPVDAGNGRVRQASEGNRRDETQHDAKRSPHLPHHDEGTSDIGWRALCTVHGGGARLGTDGEAEQKPGEKQIPPGVGGHHPERGNKGDQTGDKDGAAAAEPVVQGGAGPAADDCRAEVGSAIEQAFLPFVGDVELFEVESSLISIGILSPGGAAYS